MCLSKCIRDGFCPTYKDLSQYRVSHDGNILENISSRGAGVPECRSKYRGDTLWFREGNKWKIIELHAVEQVCLFLCARTDGALLGSYMNAVVPEILNNQSIYSQMVKNRLMGLERNRLISSGYANGSSRLAYSITEAGLKMLIGIQSLYTSDALIAGINPAHYREPLIRAGEYLRREAA